MATEKVDILQVNTEPSRTSVKDLRKEMKSLKDELLNLDEGTAEYNATLQKAAGIQHTLKEQMEEVNASAMDAGQILGNASNAVAGMTGAFQAGAGIMNMFGVESEASMEMIAKMQNVMAITQGFQAIDDGMKAFKRLGIAIKATTVFQKLFGDMQLVSAAKTKILELATKGWGKALIATGIGAIVVLIGTLIANLDKLTAVFESSSEKAAKAAKSANESMVSGLENEIEIMEASGASVDELYKKNYELYQMKRKQMAADLAAMKDKDSEEYKEAKAALAALDQEQKVANAKYQKGIDDKHAEEAKSNQKAIDDAKNKRDQDAENKRKERENQRKQDLANIDNLNAELAAKRRTDEEQELYEIQTKYDTDLALLKKYGKDTSDLTSQYEKAKQDVKNKYIAEGLAKEQEAADKRADIAKQALDNQLTDMDDQYAEADLRQAEALDAGLINEATYNQNLRDLRDERLQDEINALEQAKLNKDLNAEQLAEIDRQLTAKQKEQVDQRIADKKDAVDKEIALEQYKTDAMFKLAGSLSGILNTAADMAEEGSKEKKALQISSTIIDTIAGAVGAFMGITKDTNGWGIAVAAATAAGVLASGFASIKKMTAVKVGKGGSGGPSIPSVSLAGLAASQAPVQATTQVTGASTEATMQDTRVYVVESDITNTQRKVGTAEAEATF